MRDEYIADVGDYGKFGLLRALTSGDSGRPESLTPLGVVWYYRKNRAFDYLGKPQEYESCDKSLFGTLRTMVHTNTKNVRGIEASSVLPADTKYYPDQVPPDFEQRRQWLKDAIGETRKCQLVFLDPDTGLRPGQVPESNASTKHTYYDEIGQFLSAEKSVVVYHHLGRKKHDEEIRAHSKGLRSQFSAEVTALRFRSYFPRVYFVLGLRQHAGILNARIAVLRTEWRGHFE